MPSKEILRALLGAHVWIERTELEPIKLAINEDGWVFLVGTLAREPGEYLRGWLREVIVAIYVDVVGLVGCFRWGHSKQDTFIW